MLNNNSAYKYETPYNGPSMIIQCCINGTATLQCDTTKNRHNIRRIKLYISDNVYEDINIEKYVRQ